MTRPLDTLDAQLMQLFADEPRVGVLEASRRIGVARGTVQARLNRLAASGVITGWGPQVDPTALGHPVTAFLTLQIRQGSGPDQATAHESVASHLAEVPEVLEAYTITGAGDLWCRCVARSNADLQRVIDEVVAHPGVERTSTVIALATQIGHRVLPLVHQVADQAAPPLPGAPVAHDVTMDGSAEPPPAAGQ